MLYANLAPHFSSLQQVYQQRMNQSKQIVYQASAQLEYLAMACQTLFSDYSPPSFNTSSFLHSFKQQSDEFVTSIWTSLLNKTSAISQPL